MTVRTALLTVCAAVALAVAGGLAAAQQAGEVTVDDDVFVPSVVTVTEGATVTWSHVGYNPHSITAVDGSFDSHPSCPPQCLGTGGTFSRAFTEPGEFDYYCKIHGSPGQGMAGTVVVEPAPDPGPGPDPDPSPDPDPQPSGSCPGDVPAHPYTDREGIPEVHRSNVDCASERGIVAGFADGSYGPTLPVRRDQMASFVARTVDDAEGATALPPADASDAPFGDIAGNPHADNIRRLHAAGIVGGRTATMYDPASPVRRDQVATFVLRAVAYATGTDVRDVESGQQAFGDVGPGNVHFRRVNGATELGLVQGRGPGTYHPAGSTRRDQMASVVIRALGAIEDATAGADT